MARLRMAAFNERVCARERAIELFEAEHISDWAMWAPVTI